MDIVSKPRKKAYKSFPMEGMVARWYARNTAGALEQFEADAARIAARLKPHSRVLELAPGPGYLAVALARRGPYRVSGLDISRSFVAIARETAARAGVAVDFQHGDAANIPFAADTFDFIVCRAAFKNFADPDGALREIRRVLKPEGEGLIIDMSKEATDEAIEDCVEDLRLGAVDALMTRAVFKHSLRKRAYSKADFQRMAAAASLKVAEITAESISLDVWLRK